MYNTVANKCVYLLYFIVFAHFNLKAQSSIDTIFFPNTKIIQTIKTEKGKKLFFQEFNEDGLLLKKYTLVNNQLDGKVVYWWPNGKIKSVIHCCEGTYCGKQINYFESGNKESESNYKVKNGIAFLTGFKIEYFPNGNKKSSINYHKNIRNGLYIEWYKNGNKKKEFKYKNGNILSEKEWYVSGLLNYSGEYIIIKKANEKTLIAKNGIWKEYYESGNIKKHEKYINGKLDGIYEEWYDNKKLKTRSSYKNGNPVCEEYKTWNTNGNLEYNSITVYKNNLLLEKKDYYNNILESLTKFNIVNKNGRDTTDSIAKKITYYTDGQIKSENNIKGNNLIGQGFEYYPNGKLKAEYFSNGERREIINLYANDGSFRLKSILKIDTINEKIIFKSLPEEKYYDNGKLKEKRIYYKGKLQCEIYKDENGNILSQSNYFLHHDSYGNNHIFWNAFFYLNGSIKSEKFVFYGDIGVEIEYYSDGKLKRYLFNNIIDIIWLQNGKILRSLKLNPYSNIEKDTILDSLYVKQLYNKLSFSKNKFLNSINTKNHDTIRSYYDENQVKFETVINNNLFDKYFKAYYPDGTVMMDLKLKNCILDGSYILKNTNGTINRSGHIKDGKEVGKNIYNSFLGIPRNEFEYDSNNVLKSKKDFFDNGKPKYYTIYEGKKQISFKEWNSNGTLKYISNQNQDTSYNDKGQIVNRSIHLDKDKKKSEFYHYKNGVLNCQYTYFNGNKSGQWISYFKNGKPNIIGYYKKGLEDSLWIYYDSISGKQINIEKYKNGKFIETAETIMKPCYCAEPIINIFGENNNLGNYISIDTTHLSFTKYLFYPVIKKYFDDIYLDGNYYKNCNYNNNCDISFHAYLTTKIEIPISTKKGILLVLNPCKPKKNVSTLYVSGSVYEKAPEKTNINIIPYKLGFKFSNQFLIPTDTLLKEAVAVFKVSSLKMFDNKLTMSTDISEQCMPETRIAKTQVSFILKKFDTHITTNNLNIKTEYNSFAQKLSLFMFTGLNNGTGLIKMIINKDEVRVDLNKMILGENFILGTLTLDYSKNNKVSITDIADYLKSQGFVTDIKYENPQNQTPILKFLYIRK